MQENTNIVESDVKIGEVTGAIETQPVAEKEPKVQTNVEGSEDIEAKAQKIADSIVAKKLAKMPTKEELKSFKDWQESQKTPKWKKISTNEVNLSSLNVEYTIDLIEDFNKFNEIKVVIGQDIYKENIEIYLDPSSPTLGQTCCLNALDLYKFWFYVCLGETLFTSENKRKVCCMPREIMGYNISFMKIFAVYGRY